MTDANDSEAIATPTNDQSDEYHIIDDLPIPIPPASKEKYFDGSRFKVREFSNDFIRKYNVKKVNGDIVAYHDGLYMFGEQLFYGLMIDMLNTINRAQCTEVMFRLYGIFALPGGETSEAPPRYVKFRNGIYDILEDVLLPNSPEFVILNTIPHDFDDTAVSQILDVTFDKLTVGNAELKSVLEEMIGYMLYRSNEFKKAFILLGGGNNGKSVFVDLLDAMFGSSNISYVELQNLEDRYGPVDLYGKLVNIHDDIKDTYMSNASHFKNAVSGGVLEAQQKYQTKFFFRSYATMLFTANDMPRIRDNTGAVMDRFIPIPFLAEFKASDPDYDPHIRQKLITEETIQALIVVALKGMRRVLENKQFTHSLLIEKEMATIKYENDQLNEFTDDNAPYGRDRDTYYDEYVQFDRKARGGRSEPMRRDTFVRRINKMFGCELRRVDGQHKEFILKVIPQNINEKELNNLSVIDRYIRIVKDHKISLFSYFDKEAYGFSDDDLEHLADEGYIYTNDGKNYLVGVNE